MSKVLVIGTSLRTGSNSDRFAEEVVRGAKAAGHEVEWVTLKGKEIHFCTGCFVCLENHQCIFHDGAAEIAEKVRRADTLVFATPIYYYEMSGQMKTLLDRCNPLFGSDYQFRKVYLVSTAAEDAPHVPEKALSGLQGWVDCFDRAELAGSFFCGGVNNGKEAETREKDLARAYDFGMKLQ